MGFTVLTPTYPSVTYLHGSGQWGSALVRSPVSFHKSGAQGIKVSGPGLCGKEEVCVHAILESSFRFED